MKPNSRLHQLNAFILILIFSIQAGLGMWLHETFHHHSSTQSSAYNTRFGVVQQATFSFSCTCADQLIAPFIAVASPEITLPVRVFFTEQTIADYCNITCAMQVFRPLRAPPVFFI